MNDATRAHRADLERSIAAALRDADQAREVAASARRDGDDVTARVWEERELSELDRVAALRADRAAVDEGRRTACAADSHEVLDLARRVKRRNVRDAAGRGLPTAGLRRSYRRTRRRCLLAQAPRVGAAIRRTAPSSGRPRGRRARRAATAAGPDGSHPGGEDPPGDAGPTAGGAS